MATKLILKVDPASPIVYANYAAVQNTPTDIIIRFCLLDPMRGERETTEDDAGETLSLESLEVSTAVSVFLNAEVAGALVNAIAEGIERYRMQREAALEDNPETGNG